MSSIMHITGDKKTREIIYKYRFVIAFVLLSLVVFMASRITVVSASTPAEDSQIRQKIDNVLNGILITNVEYMKQAYDSFNGVASESGSGHAAQFLPFISKARPFIMGLAYFFCFVFSTIGIIKESQRGEISEEYWTRIFVSTVVAIVVVANIHLVMDSLYDLGGVVIEGMVNATDRYSTDFSDTEIDFSKMNDEQKRKLLHQMAQLPGLNGYEEDAVQSDEGTEDAGAGTTTGGDKEKKEPDESDLEHVRIGTIEDVYYGTTDAYLANQYINYLIEPLQLICLLPMLASLYLMFSMLFEIKLRQLFAPLAVATIGYDGARASGIRFLKKYLACFVRIGMYFVIAAIGTDMTRYFYVQVITTEIVDGAEMTIGIATNLLLMFGSNALAAMTMLQAGSLADEIVGI